MNIQAILNRGAPDKLVQAVNTMNAGTQNSIAFHLQTDNLKVGDYKDGEIVIEEARFSSSYKNPFLQLTLDGVSTADRTAGQIMGILASLEKKYTLLIQDNVPKGTRMSLFVRIRLDAPLPSLGGKALIESKEAIWVEGEDINGK